MSSLDLPVLMDRLGRRAATGDATAPLRFLLCAGEVLRLPRRRITVSVLSGIAWITQAGRDIVLQKGDCRDLVCAADCPVISAIGTEALLFETR